MWGFQGGSRLLASMLPPRVPRAGVTSKPPEHPISAGWGRFPTKTAAAPAAETLLGWVKGAPKKRSFTPKILGGFRRQLLLVEFTPKLHFQGAGYRAGCHVYMLPGTNSMGLGTRGALQEQRRLRSGQNHLHLREQKCERR
ncbi:hypothetical protein Anapl_12353 [Anas platyrhynchos]|uniref:Uncharacterized protein n=1 Tax=Anas platyrhynchos TaxID=8839 RepID=R0JA99_ANAPL|nr:hypothetical protein Anapl_12353 [Anas platyrhynchos]